MSNRSFKLSGLVSADTKRQTPAQGLADEVEEEYVSPIDLEYELGPSPKVQATRDWIEAMASYYFGPDFDKNVMDDLEARKLTVEQVENELLEHKTQKLSGPLVSRYDRSVSNRMLIYLPAAKLVFCPIGKVANTAVKAWAIELSGRPVESEAGIHRAINERDVPLNVEAWTRWRFDQVCQNPDWAFAALVRDPAVRLVSAYWDKFVIHRASKSTLRHTWDVLQYIYDVDEVQDENVDRGISFRQFCQYLNATPRHSLDSHWAAQHRYLENFQWDYLFDLDRVQDFENFVKGRCGLGYNSIPLGMRNAVPKREGVTAHVEPLVDTLPKELLAASVKRPSIHAFLTPDIERFISNYYSTDYVLLNAARHQRGKMGQLFEGFKKLTKLVRE